MKLNESGLPFDDFRALLGSLPGSNEEIRLLTADQVSERLGPAPGKLGDLCEWYSAWSGRSPVISRPVVTLFAGTHAVDQTEDDWLFSQITAISQGAGAINRLCHDTNLGLKVLDLALQIPVSDITVGAALDEKACAGTIAFGMEAIAGGADLLCVSAVERGLNISTLALLSVLTGIEVKTLAQDCGHDAADRIVAPAAEAVARAERFKDDPLELLRHLGGRETAAICGAVLAARSQHVPVLVAGYTGLVALAILSDANKEAVTHCMLAQSVNSPLLMDKGAETGIVPVSSDFLSFDPVLQLGLAAQILKSAALAWQIDPVA